MGQVVSQFIADYGELLAEGVRDTIIMTAVATLLAYVIGLPIGVLLITSAKKGIRPNAPLNTVLGWIVNIVRSVPFIILLVAIIPLTRLIVGTSLGVPGAIVPLVITAAPFVRAWWNSRSPKWTAVWWRPRKASVPATCRSCSRCCCSKACHRWCAVRH